MYNTSTSKKYMTISTYVDIETGEIITKSKQEREYYKIKTTKSYEHNEKYTIIRWTHECRRNGQTSLFGND